MANSRGTYGHNKKNITAYVLSKLPRTPNWCALTQYRPPNFVLLDAIMLLKMWLDPGAPHQLAGLHVPPIGSQLVHSLRATVYSISTKAHTSWLRNSFSWHAVTDICCLRQTNIISHYFHNLPLSQKLDPRLIPNGEKF